MRVILFIALIPVLSSAGLSPIDLANTLNTLDSNLRKLDALLIETESAPSNALFAPAVCNGRLTLESGVPVSTTDQSNKSTLYFTPYHGNKIGVYDGSKWLFKTFTERSLALSSLTANKNYDVFIYDNSGTLTLELSSAWTSDNTRANALTLLNGVYVKSGTTTRRWLGTIRTTSTTQTQDTTLKRFVWNACNRRPRLLLANDISSTEVGEDNYASYGGNGFSYVVGSADAFVMIQGALLYESKGDETPATVGNGGAGDDTTISSQLFGAMTPATNGKKMNTWSEFRGYPSLGYTYQYWLHHGTTLTVPHVHFNTDGKRYQGGLIGTVEG